MVRSTYVVYGALELGRKDSLGGCGKLLVEGEGSSLGAGIVGNIGGLKGLLGLGMLRRDLRAVDLELVRIEHDFLRALLDIKGDLDGTLVAKVSSKLDIVEGDGVMRGLHAAEEKQWSVESSLCVLLHTYLSGRMSLSDAMIAEW